MNVILNKQTETKIPIFTPWLQLNDFHALLELGDRTVVTVLCLFRRRKDSHSLELEMALGNPWWVRNIWRNQSRSGTGAEQRVIHSLFQAPAGAGNSTQNETGETKPLLTSKMVSLPQRTGERSQTTELGTEETGKWNKPGKDPANRQRDESESQMEEGFLWSDAEEWRQITRGKY